jgi:peptidoglycan/xylan/chitin deacetylase (PgdA/CDA1 family)
MMFFPRLLRKSAIAHLPLPGLVRLPAGHRSKIHLTFDDGPHRELTPRTLDMLASYAIKATFFVIGSRVANLPGITERIVREGHMLANHAYRPEGISRLSVEEGFDEVERCNKAIAPFGGQRIFRPPNGLLSPILYQRLVRVGYKIDFWTFDSNDSKGLSSEEIAARLLERDMRGEVILLHDDRPQGIEALRMFLEQTKDRGYEYARLDGGTDASAASTER